MKIYSRIFFSAALLLVLAAFSVSDNQPKITSEEVSDHIKYLSSDELADRVQGTAGERLAQLQRELLAQGVELKFADCPRPLREQLQRLNARGLLEPQEFFVSVGKAAQAFEQRS